MIKVFIDPGHGGTDPGAVGNGLQEKDLTLAISKKIRDILLANYEGVSVKLSREGDQTLSLKQRTDMANAREADFLASIHINAGGGTGYEDFRHNMLSVNSRTGIIQSIIHKAITNELKEFGIRDRGAKSANFHMLRESKMAAFLSENLFIDNVSDAQLLKQSRFIDAVAKGHAVGIAIAFNLKAKKHQPKTIHFYTGGYKADALAKVHAFIDTNKWWFKPERNEDGSMSFLIGGFSEGSEAALKMEQFLKDNKFWYQIQ